MRRRGALESNMFAAERDLPALDDRSARCSCCRACRAPPARTIWLAPFWRCARALDLGEVEAAYASERGQLLLTRR